MNSRTLKIYNRMLQMFGSSAVREYGELNESSDFAIFCESADNDHIKRIFRLCLQQLSTGNQFAPTLGSLSQMQLMITDEEYYQIVDSIESRKSSDTDWRIDWIIRRHSTEIKLCSALYRRRTVSNLYREACKRGEERCSRSNFKLLTCETVRDKKIQHLNFELPISLQNIVSRIDRMRQSSL